MNKDFKGSKKEHRIKGKQYLTLMMITDATKSAKTIKIPKWIRFPLLAMSVAIVLKSLTVFEHVEKLEAELAYHKLITQEATIDSTAKADEISELEVKLKDTQVSKYEELIELQELANQLGARLADLETFRNEMQDYKNEIDNQLNNEDDSADNDVNNSTGSTEVITDQSLALGFESAESETSILRTSPMTYEIDYDAEIQKINGYLTNALFEIEQDLQLSEKTSEELSEMIPYVEAYPSVLPIENTYITSNFGYRSNPFSGRGREFHTGVDLKASYQEVSATGAGVVVESGYQAGYGYTILIDHGYGLSTKYAHNSKLYVSVGDQVVRGDIIAKSGNSGRSTGPHLHYEVLLEGEPQNPLDYIYENEE
ncbi:MAG: M23 family metallopeptidase [Vallitaleaceae bacterium]|nr:M23 family metallopeptidase [Vallitaleaceae bacterium]